MIYKDLLGGLRDLFKLWLFITSNRWIKILFRVDFEIMYEIDGPNFMIRHQLPRFAAVNMVSKNRCFYGTTLEDALTSFQKYIHKGSKTFCKDHIYQLARLKT